MGRTHDQRADRGVETLYADRWQRKLPGIGQQIPEVREYNPKTPIANGRMEKICPCTHALVMLVNRIFHGPFGWRWKRFPQFVFGVRIHARIRIILVFGPFPIHVRSRTAIASPKYAFVFAKANGGNNIMKPAMNNWNNITHPPNKHVFLCRASNYKTCVVRMLLPNTFCICSQEFSDVF